MSYSAKRFQGKVANVSLEEALFEDGYRYVANQLEDIYLQQEFRTWDLTQEEIHFILDNRGIKQLEEIMSFLPQKSRGATWIAKQVYFRHYQHEFDIKSLCGEWSAVRELRNWEFWNDGLCKRLDVSYGKLMHIGIRFAWQADRFCALYEQVYNANRPWGSCFQVSHGKVKAIALTPNYNRLPLWAKKVMVNSSEWVQTGERIGNIWNLKVCAKAWKHAPQLPKCLAKKIGKLSTKAKLLARYAWDTALAKLRFSSLKHANQSNWIRHEWNGQDYEDVKIERGEVIKEFWMELDKWSALPLGQLVDFIPDPYVFSKLAESMLGLPNNLLEELKKENNKQEWLQAIATYASPEQACKVLFGVGGKRTAALFKQTAKNNWRWASAIAYKDADAVQKVLEVKDVINFQQEAAEFLLSLPMQSRIRLLSATTFRYRGQVNLITDDHVRDTGYLWSNVKSKPELGRVRCWFSAHEQLSAAYVRDLPDEVLPVNPNWKKVDGLCAVDGSWELEFPKRVATLKYYGQMLKNCVGGYGEAIKSGRSIIFVVREKGMLTHCVEISSGDVRQFYQAGNSSPNYAIKNSVCEALRQAQLI